ncbi:21177_t:CDS:2 [Entrophospora sp. SA101]|nr:21177_t:CDS:2 [Entrophospora sp. SA101]
MKQDINTSYSQQIDRLQDEECDNNEMTEDSLIEFENKYKQMSTDKNGNCHRVNLLKTLFIIMLDFKYDLSYLRYPYTYASTCSNTLILCEDYEISTQGFAQFRNDLIEAFYNCEGFININANQPEIIDLESNNLSNEINSFPLYSKCNSHSSPQQPSFQMPTKDQLQHNPYIRNNSNNNGNNNVQRRYRQRQRSNNNNFEFINYSIDNYVNGNQH